MSSEFIRSLLTLPSAAYCSHARPFDGAFELPCCWVAFVFLHFMPASGTDWEVKKMRPFTWVHEVMLPGSFRGAGREAKKKQSTP